jgi:hypothetical protein
VPSRVDEVLPIDPVERLRLSPRSKEREKQLGRAAIMLLFAFFATVYAGLLIVTIAVLILGALRF